MKDLIAFSKKVIKGSGFLYFLNFFTQFLMVLVSVFASFLTKVLVDALRQNFGSIDPITRLVLHMLTLGRGEDYLYQHMYVLPFAMLLTAFVMVAVSIARMLIRFYTSARINKKMQLILFKQLESQPYSYYKQAKAGDLIQICTRDCDVMRRFLIMDMNQLSYTLYVVILCMSILGLISYKLMLVSAAVFPLLFVYSFFLIKEVRRRYRATDDSEAKMTDKISENLAAVRVIKAYNAENYEISDFEKRLKEYEEKFIHWRMLSSFFYASSDIFIFASRSIAIAYAVYLAFTGEITAGTVAISFTFVNMMVWPLRQSATGLSNLGQTLASSDRIHKLLLSPIEEIDVGEEPEIKGEVVFDHVSFAYPDRPGELILDDISFKVPSGSTIAIMGKTGSGKSTLSQLLTRLYEPTSGTIYIDGVPLNKVKKSYLRKKVVPVLQDPFLFSKTISENIKMAKVDATDEEMKKAAHNAAVDEAISSFDKGYETPVGEKGVTLSGGQKQRVAIARTILTGAPVLLFDDSLSAVDAETDLSIRSHLKRMKTPHTTFLITHRVNSAKDADMILVLEKGKVAEIGTHKELLAIPGLYQRIASIQSDMGFPSDTLEKGGN